MTTENWVAVPGYEGIYEVSDLGRVRSVDRLDARGHTRGGKVLSPGRGNKQGHVTVALCRGGVQRTHYVHQLVLTAFVGPRPKGMEACHGNDVPADNRLSNLRWDTPSANRVDSVRNGGHRNAARTKCPQGHPYSTENTYHHPSGSRVCRECGRINRRATTAEVSAA